MIIARTVPSAAPNVEMINEPVCVPVPVPDVKDEIIRGEFFLS